MSVTEGTSEDRSQAAGGPFSISVQSFVVRNSKRYEAEGTPYISRWGLVGAWEMLVFSPDLLPS